VDAAPVLKSQKVYHLQLAAYRTKAQAEKGWRQLVLKAPDILDDMSNPTLNSIRAACCA